MKRPRHKYNAQPVEQDGKRYDSKREARYAQELAMRQRAGEVVGWLEQVPIRLPGKTRYVVDFLIFEADGSCRFVDVKGVVTDTFKMKKRQVEELHPWLEIEVVR